MTSVGDSDETLLARARTAREGRDQWRRVAPILRSLRDRGVPIARITEETGISRSTIARLSGLRRRGSTTTDN